MGGLATGPKAPPGRSGSVSVRTLTARSPGGRDGWACGNPIGPSSSPPECRSAGRLLLRTTTGFRRPTRLCRPPRGARAAESCIEGLSWNTDDHARPQASVPEEGWGHAISSGRTREPRHSSPRSDLEHRGEAGRGGWGLGNPVVVRRARRTRTRQAGGGPDSPIGFPQAPPAPTAPGVEGRLVGPGSELGNTAAL